MSGWFEKLRYEREIGDVVLKGQKAGGMAWKLGLMGFVTKTFTGLQKKAVKTVKKKQRIIR